MTAPPTISELFSDSLEFQLVVPSFGITHPTGYPLYTLLGGVWSRLLFPFGNWAWRMNLFSALAAATAITLLALLGQRLMPAPAGTVRIPWAALAFAFVPVWWQQATLAEVYALHLCFVAAILLTAVNNEGNGQILQFSLIGLSLAHHRTAVLLLPALLIYWLWTQPALFRPRRAWISWTLALLSPLLLYAYLPIRAMAGVRDLHGDYTNTWAGFLRHVLALGYTSFLASNPLAQKRGLLDWLALFQQQLGSWILIVAVGAAIVGFFAILFGQRTKKTNAAWMLIALVLVANLIFAVNYQVADVEVFLLPVFFCAALFFEAGINGLLSFMKKHSAPKQYGVHSLLSVVLVGLILFTADWQSMRNRANDWSIHNYAVAMAKTDFPPNSRVIGLEGEMSALRYMQQAESLGQNAQPIAANSDTLRAAALVQSLADGDPTYLTRELPGIEETYDFSGEGVLVRVWDKESLQLDPLPQSLDVILGDGSLKLIAYDLQRLNQAGGSAWQLTLDWQAQQQIEQSLKVSLRWLDATGATLLLPNGEPGQDEFPLRQVSPTQYWQPGKTMRDVQIVNLPSAIQKTATTLQTIVYDSATGSEVGRWQVDLPSE